MQDPNKDNDKVDIQQAAFEPWTSGYSAEIKDGPPSLYKFKINMNDLMDQVAKNNPNAGRNPH